MSRDLVLAAIVLCAGAVTAQLWSMVGGRTNVLGAATTAGTVQLLEAEAEPRGGALSSALLWTTFAALTGAVAARWLAAARPPLGNMYEYNVALAWGMTLFCALHEVRFRQHGVSVLAMGLVLTMLLLNEAFFPSQLTTLVPALQANRILGIHVATMMMSYAALSVSFAAAVLYLVQGRTRRLAGAPPQHVLEEISEWSVMIGFPMLALGIALGAWWANSAWGRYWGWDPKETSALVTWLIYAVYLHAHHLRGWRGTRAAWLLVLGYGGVVFTYFVVNIWVAGLHSYAGL